MSFDFTDTIAGIATAPGVGGVSIIRISGDQALTISNNLFHPTGGAIAKRPRTLAHGWLQRDGQDLDEVLCVYMPGPHSFTAEDVVEVHCHGGAAVSHYCLELAMAGGARLSRPGEFTQRAFVNGRIDLTQAEAIDDITKAKTALGLEISVNQLKGKLLNKIQELKEKVSWILALVNASIDFPEEDTLFAHHSEIEERLEWTKTELTQLIKNSAGSMTVKEGFKLALAGVPNVGKSSLLNGFLKEERAIVTETAGTTRDIIEEAIEVKGLPLVLLDTAGIRATTNEIEQMGIERSIKAMAQADMILWVIDATQPAIDLNEETLGAAKDKPIFVIYNKMDLSTGKPDLKLPFVPAGISYITAHKAEDIESLKLAIFDYVESHISGLHEEASLTNLRQIVASKNALAATIQGLESFGAGVGEEVISFELAELLRALGEIVGETTPDEMLNQIFSNFCIGK